MNKSKIHTVVNGKQKQKLSTYMGIVEHSTIALIMYGNLSRSTVSEKVNKCMKSRQ